MGNYRNLIDLLAGVPTPTGIQFCDCRFSEPTWLLSMLPPIPAPGLYAILVPDTTCRPRQYRVIYFGQASNLSQRVRTSHEKYREWVQAAGGVNDLYVALHFMWGSDEEGRTAVERKLIAHYTPCCNEVFNSLWPFPGLLR